MLNPWGGGYRKLSAYEAEGHRSKMNKAEAPPEDVIKGDNEGIEGLENLPHAQLQLILELYNLGIMIRTKDDDNDAIETIKVKQKFEEDMKPPAEVDYTLLEREVWYEEKRIGQIYHDRARDKWFEDEGYIATAFGFAICAYSIWTFPQLVIKYGGITFCSMYLIITCAFTVPAIYMELVVGQFTQKGLFHCWRLCPIFQGLRFVMLWNTFLTVVVNNTRLLWFALYMCESLRLPFPWASCDKEWTSVNCKDFNTMQADLQLNDSSRSPAFEFFRARVLRVWKSKFADDVLSVHPFSPARPKDDRFKIIPYPNLTKHLNGQNKYSIDEIGIPAVDLLVLLLILDLICYMVLRFRVRYIGVYNFFFLFFGFTLLVIPFTNAWILPRGSKGLLWFINMDNSIDNFLLGEAWMAAIQHSLMSTGLGTGAYIMFGSHREYTNRRIKTIAIAAGFGSWIAHCLIALMMAVYSVDVNSYNNTGSYSKSYFGSDLIIDVYPLIMSLGVEPKLSRFYVSVFFTGLTCICIVRTFGGIYILKRTVMDCFRELFDAFRIFYDDDERGQMHRWERFRLIKEDQESSDILLKAILLLTTIPVVLCLTRGGIFILLFLENYSLRLSNSIVFLLEMFAFTYIWGTRLLDIAVSSMTCIQSTLFYRLAWKYFIPAIITIYFLNNEFIFRLIEFDDIIVPEYFHYIGLTFGIGPPLLVLLSIGVYRVVTAPVRGFLDKFKLSIAPEYEWSKLAAGRLPSNRTWWIHYMNFPSGYGLGRRYPKAPEEMYATCLNFGRSFRTLFINKFSFGIFSRNLFCLKYPKSTDELLSPGQTMEVYVTKEKQKPSPERRLNKKLLRQEEEDKKITQRKQSNFLKIATKENTVYFPQTEDPSLLTKTQSNPEIHANADAKTIETDPRTEAIRMSLKSGEIRKSMRTSEDQKHDSLKESSAETTVQEIPDGMGNAEDTENNKADEAEGNDNDINDTMEEEIEKRPIEPVDSIYGEIPISKQLEEENRMSAQSDKQNRGSAQSEQSDEENEDEEYEPFDDDQSSKKHDSV